MEAKEAIGQQLPIRLGIGGEQRHESIPDGMEQRRLCLQRLIQGCIGGRLDDDPGEVRDSRPTEMLGR